MDEIVEITTQEVERKLISLRKMNWSKILIGSSC